LRHWEHRFLKSQFARQYHYLTSMISFTSTMTYSGDGRYLALGTPQGQLQVYRLDNERLIYDLVTDLGSISALAFAPDHQRLAVGGGRSNAINIWDVKEKRLSLSFKINRSSVRCLAWSADGKQLVSGGPEGLLWLWDVDTGKHRVLDGHRADVIGVAFTP